MKQQLAYIDEKEREKEVDGGSEEEEKEEEGTEEEADDLSISLILLSLVDSIQETFYCDVEKRCASSFRRTPLAEMCGVVLLMGIH